MNSDGFKGTPNRDMFFNILISTFDIHLTYITNIINWSIEGFFHDERKL